MQPRDFRVLWEGIIRLRQGPSPALCVAKVARYDPQPSDTSADTTPRQSRVCSVRHRQGCVHPGTDEGPGWSGGSGCLRSRSCSEARSAGAWGHGDPPGTDGAVLACSWTPGPSQPPVWVSVALPFTERARPCSGGPRVRPGNRWAAIEETANEVRGSDHSLQAQTGVLVGGQLHLWLTHTRPAWPPSRQRGSVEAPPAQNPGGQTEVRLPGGPWWPQSPLIGSQRPQGSLGMHPTQQPVGPTQSHFLPARERWSSVCSNWDCGHRKQPWLGLCPGAWASLTLFRQDDQHRTGVKADIPAGPHLPPVAHGPCTPTCSASVLEIDPSSRLCPSTADTTSAPLLCPLWQTSPVDHTFHLPLQHHLQGRGRGRVNHSHLVLWFVMGREVNKCEHV